jgi:RNA polymerase sigma-70 factor (ECF subfamily)
MKDNFSGNLSALIDEYGSSVLNTAYLYLNDRQLAEDVFQEVFLKAYLKMDTFEFRSSVKTWLIRITINQCKDTIKSAYKRRVNIGLDNLDDSLSSESAEQIAEENFESERLYRAVMSLEPKHRELILLRYYNQLSLDEIASVLHISNGAVRTRLSRVTAVLKKVYNEQMIEKIASG